jgi:hypothetical protein
VQANTVDQGNLNDLRTQRYTSMVDLNATLKLSHLPYIVPGHFVVKYARDLRTDDFKNGNIILLGLAHTDPWANLLQTSMNFRFACGTHVDDCYIRNSGRVQENSWFTGLISNRHPIGPSRSLCGTISVARDGYY